MTPETLFALPGKTALVTGGATGIGRMAAEALVRAGARVMISSRKGDACEAVAAELNALGALGSAEGFAGDVSTQEGVEALAAEVQRRTDGLDILMNNAGKAWGAPLGNFPFAAWETVMSKPSWIRRSWYDCRPTGGTRLRPSAPPRMNR